MKTAQGGLAPDAKQKAPAIWLFGRRRSAPGWIEAEAAVREGLRRAAWESSALRWASPCCQMRIPGCFWFPLPRLSNSRFGYEVSLRLTLSTFKQFSIFSQPIGEVLALGVEPQLLKLVSPFVNLFIAESASKNAFPFQLGVDEEVFKGI